MRQPGHRSRRPIQLRVFMTDPPSSAISDRNPPRNSGTYTRHVSHAAAAVTTEFVSHACPIGHELDISVENWTSSLRSNKTLVAEVRKPVRPYPVLAADGRNDLFEPSSPVFVRSAVPQPVPKNLSSSRSPQISVGRSQRLQRLAIALRANAARTPRRMG